MVLKKTPWRTCMSIHFLTSSKLFLNCHCTQLKSCVGLGLGDWLFAHPIISSFRITFDIFSSALHVRLGLPHPLIHGFSQCICRQPINSIGIHLLCYAHGGERIVTHDVDQGFFTSIVRDDGFHVSCKQTHVLLRPFFLVILTTNGYCFYNN